MVTNLVFVDVPYPGLLPVIGLLPREPTVLDKDDILKYIPIYNPSHINASNLKEQNQIQTFNNLTY